MTVMAVVPMNLQNVVQFVLIEKNKVIMLWDIVRVKFTYGSVKDYLYKVNPKYKIQADITFRSINAKQYNSKIHIEQVIARNSDRIYYNTVTGDLHNNLENVYSEELRELVIVPDVTNQPIFIYKSK